MKAKKILKIEEKKNVREVRRKEKTSKESRKEGGMNERKK